MYVDDIVLTASLLRGIIDALTVEFSMKNLVLFIIFLVFQWLHVMAAFFFLSANICLIFLREQE
jgi:hypothetical protein